MTRPSTFRPVVSIAIGTGVGALLLGYGIWAVVQNGDRRLAQDSPGGTLADDSKELKPVNPGYLGPQACAECHRERVAEFQATRHFQANCVPRAGAMPSGFQPGSNELPFPELSLRFQMGESEGKFLQTSTQETPAGTKQQTSRIAFVYGAAGGNDEVYFTWHGDRLRELPMVWLESQKAWGASPFDRHGGGDFSRDMTIRCVECHNTWFEHVPGSRNQYGHQSNLLGVTCEVCHGPGSKHVTFHHDNPGTKEPQEVVRPAQLSRDRQMDLCAQCHSNALKHRGPAFSYRPGLPLDDFYVTLRTKHPEEDHVANQTTYLRQSRCFQESDSLTCVTCHNPHQSRSSSNAGAESCKSCHAPKDCSDQDRLPATVRDDCIGCHMPEHRKIQVYFRTNADRYVAPVKRYEHKIGIYPLARQAVLRDWYAGQADADSRVEAQRLSLELAESWKVLCEQRASDKRFLAAIDAARESLRFASDPSLQERLRALIAIQDGIDSGYQDALWHESEKRYPEAIDAFKKVLATKPDFAMAHARLGTTYAIVGEKELANSHLEAAVKFDPDDPYAPGMLGWLAFLDGRPEVALEYYRHADEVEPYSAKINYQIGLALAKLERWPDAVERLRKSVKIDPQGVQAMVTLSQTLRRVEQLEESITYAKNAAQLSGYEEPEIILNLSDAYADAGQWNDAIQAAEKGLAAAQKYRPRLVPQLRQRLADYRNRQHKQR